MQVDSIVIKKAAVNNLKDVTISIPREKFVVVTGISGSGKSSLAFDTLFAEGQRRFAESLSSYARQFLGRMSKPDVESIDGIPPAIAIEQKVSVKNPRSTVATTTEIYDYLRLVFARIGHTFSPVSGREVHADSTADVVAYLDSKGPEGYVFILSELDWAKRSDRVELLLSLKEDGWDRLYAGGIPLKIDEVLQHPESCADDAMLLVDRFRDFSDRDRLLSSIESAFKVGHGRMSVLDGAGRRDFSDRFELDGISFQKPDDYLFSFNSPLGACPVCGGLGKIVGISEDLVIPDKSKSLYDGAIACWRGDKMGWFKTHLCELAPSRGISIFEPYCNLSAESRRLIWEGEPPKEGESYDADPDRIIGLNEFFAWVDTQRYKIQYKYMLSRFSGRATCHSCHGSRLRKEALYVQVSGKNLAEVLEMNVHELLDFLDNLDITPSEREIIAEPLAELRTRLECIADVGLGYLTMNRTCNTLSGGESQRINLVSAIGSSLVGSMYILDEPSIGLHPRDTERLINVLRRLRDLGNTVIVVEHDEEIINAADVLIDMGPLAGRNGGEVVFMGRADGEILPSELKNSITLQYLKGERGRYVREKRHSDYQITVNGAMEHNLKDINVSFPLGVLTVVTGVSGSGKSSLVGDILYPALYRHINEAGDQPGTFRGLSGNLDRITRVEFVDQNPIGKSTRSNAATYLKVWDLVRDLMASQQAAKINGFKSSYFSFNQDGGRCPECQGDGIVKIGMQFISDVTMVCESCGGKRFKQEVLDVRYRGKNVDDILNMSVDDAVTFFSDAPENEARLIVQKLKSLQAVGLGYIKLGQSSSTLSGGESQRIKLAYFLSMHSSGSSKDKILFIFDEPTTGLHFYDVEKLLKSFDALLAAGHSLVVVEHNLDVIRSADWVIDLGPEAGDGGGKLVYAGTPEGLKSCPESQTAKYI